MAEVTRGVVDATTMMFGTINEEIMELMDDQIRAFRCDIATVS